LEDPARRIGRVDLQPDGAGIGYIARRGDRVRIGQRLWNGLSDLGAGRGGKGDGGGGKKKATPDDGSA
jgi:hypothetical protein